jgi:hypothetical protein
MSGEWVDDRIEEYRSRLHPEDKERFDERLEEAIEERSVSEIYDELEQQYQRSESHLELVAATASAFHQTPLADGYESGYEFAITEPLEELNSEIVGEEHVTNGDVLLVKEDGRDLYICVIECKSGSNAGREWTKELKKIEDVVDEYSETLKSQLDAEEKRIRHDQYVLVGRITQLYAMDYDQLTETMEIADNYAFWGYARGERTLVHIHGEVQDHDLKGAISDSIDTSKVENPIDFTFSDHPLTQLKVLIQSIITENQREDDEHPFEFDREEFRERFDGELQVGFSGEVREELVDDRVDSLLALGKKIEIFVDDPDRVQSSRDYRILFRGKGATVAKEAADKKYFDEMSVEKPKERAFEEVKEEFSPSQTRLDEKDWVDTDEEDNDENEGEEGGESSEQ